MPSSPQTAPGGGQGAAAPPWPQGRGRWEWTRTDATGSARTEPADGGAQGAHTQLTKQAEADRATAWREGADVRVAARQAAADAWKVLRDSPYVAVLGAIERQAPDVDTLATRLAEMRETKVPARAQQKDTGDEKRVAQLLNRRQEPHRVRMLSRDRFTRSAALSLFMLPLIAAQVVFTLTT